jgi:methylenetetrahydrofolate dehydrogenase (NADP+)/methenyltetrahydrofolate cyclohydrolase
MAKWCTKGLMLKGTQIPSQDVWSKYMSGAKIIDGKEIASKITDAIAEKAQIYSRKTGVPPCLAVIFLGDDPASAIYVRKKGQMAEKIGFRSLQKTLPAETREEELAALIEELNRDASVNGILVQLPLPAHIDPSKIVELIAPGKDVDGFHPMNVGRLGSGNFEQAMIPCTPAGCVLLAKSALGEDLSGSAAVIVGRSNIVGKPAAQLFLKENCTVTIAHSKTRNLKDVVRRGDIVVAAVGRAEMIKSDWIKPGATVIDVGMNRAPDPSGDKGKTKLVGDVDFASVKQIAGAITPAPGGVGPMTIAMLMANTLTAACRQNGLEPVAASMNRTLAGTGSIF